MQGSPLAKYQSKITSPDSNNAFLAKGVISQERTDPLP